MQWCRGVNSRWTNTHHQGQCSSAWRWACISCSKYSLAASFLCNIMYFYADKKFNQSLAEADLPARYTWSSAFLLIATEISILAASSARWQRAPVFTHRVHIHNNMPCIIALEWPRDLAENGRTSTSQIDHATCVLFTHTHTHTSGQCVPCDRISIPDQDSTWTSP